jgi:glyoxylase-like metal-dependent hydrolase (beta-lactamase superfamily II)
VAAADEEPPAVLRDRLVDRLGILGVAVGIVDVHVDDDVRSHEASIYDRAVAMEPIDLLHQGSERVIGAYLLETDDGPALHDCGPSTDVDALKAGLQERGLELKDIRHLLLSHIHLDHAGAAGVLVREHPGLHVHVSEIGAPHLIDPTRLEASARRLYGDTFDTLWGELAPVPRENIRVVSDRVLGLDCFPSPGHASHHVVYIATDGTAYCGDAAGVRIQPHELVVPPTPPPEVDVDAWHGTIDELERREPQRLALIHFGVAENPPEHLEQLRLRLDEWAAIVASGVSEEEFVAAAHLDAPEYDRAMPLWQSYAGLKRWAEKRAAA